MEHLREGSLGHQTDSHGTGISLEDAKPSIKYRVVNDTSTSDEGSRLNLLEAQIDELAARLSKVETSTMGRSTPAALVRRDTMCSERPETSSSMSDYSSTSSDGPNSPAPSVSLPFALKFSVLDSKHKDPTPERTKAIWQHYVQNIDPLLKIVHLPTVQDLFLSGTNEAKDIPQDSRALKWAICFASAASQELSKGTSSTYAGLGSLSKMYQHSFETSLAKARFMAKPTVTALQALTIYLTIGAKVLDSTYVWSLTAILVRLAFKLNLHRDPDTQNIPFRDGEYRRRLFWHICTLDAATAEANETDPLIYERQMDTSFPAAIQDHLLSQTPHTSPGNKPPTTHAPDIFYSLLRFEITYYIRTILYSPTFATENAFPILTLDGKLSIVDSLQKVLDEKYYRHCHCRSPTCTLAMLSSKIVVAALILKLRNAHPSTSPNSCKSAEQTLTACTDIMEASRALRADPMLSSWAWLWQGEVGVEFEAAETCLATLANARARPGVTGRAWSAIDGFFNAWKDTTGSRKGDPRWVRLEFLREKATKARASTISPLGRHEGRLRSGAVCFAHSNPLYFFFT